MTADERTRLIDALLDGDLSEADALRLEAELSIDPAARKEYYERIALSMLLEVEAGSSRTEAGRAVPLTTEFSSRGRRRAFLGTAGLAVAVLAMIAGWLSLPGKLEPAGVGQPRMAVTSPVEPEASGFGVVAGQSGAVWRGIEALPDGGLVPSGPLHLTAGIVQLELFSGAAVVVEGEAEFSVLSPMEMSLRRGKVRVHVPEPARGFRIHTSEGEVLDLGTEFAMNVTGDHSEVHVLEGEIEWRPRQHELHRMEQGEALRSFPDGREAAIEANAREFVGVAEFRDQLRSSLLAKHEAWRVFSEALRHDPRLVAFYQSESGDKSSRRLPNQADGRDLKAGGGAIVAAARSADRWGQPGGALDFSPTGSRVRIAVPGEYGSLTLLCWVKINSLDRWYNSLFLTDGHDLHEPHWQIMDDGRLFFSVKKRDAWDSSKGEKDKHIYLSPPFWSSALSGQWLMIATVYDVQARRVTHYLNGEILSRESIPDEYLVEQVSIGSASLGNWGLPIRNEPRFAVRNLNGSMDEFALFSGALSSNEIKELYEHGKP